MNESKIRSPLVLECCGSNCGLVWVGSAVKVTPCLRLDLRDLLAIWPLQNRWTTHGKRGGREDYYFAARVLINQMMNGSASWIA